MLLLVMVEGFYHCKGRCFLLRGKGNPAGEYLLQLRGEFHHFPLCEKLGERYSEAAADHFQGWNGGQGIPAVDICNRGFGKPAFLREAIHGPSTFAHKLLQSFERVHCVTSFCIYFTVFLNGKTRYTCIVNTVMIYCMCSMCRW